MAREVKTAVDNLEWIKKYGTMQKVYKAEKGIDPHTAAMNMLQGIEQKGTVEAIGDPSCITGYAVGIRDEHTGLVGIFQIDSDEHSWENGVHTMKLRLRFDRMVEESEYLRMREKGKKDVAAQTYKSGNKVAGKIKLRDYLTEEGYTDISYDDIDTFAVKDYVRYRIDIPGSAGVKWIDEERYVRDVSGFTYTKVAPEEGSIPVRNYLRTVYGIANEAIGYDGANATIYNTPVVIAGLQEIGGCAYAFPEAVDEVSAAILSIYRRYRYEHDLDLLPGEAYLSKYVEGEGGAVGFDGTYTHYVITVGQVSKSYPVSQFTIVNDHAVIHKSDWEDTMAYDFKGKDENGYWVGDKSGRKVIKVYPEWTLETIAEGLTGDWDDYTVLQKANMQLLMDENHGNGHTVNPGDELDVTGLLDIWEKRAVNMNGYAVKTVSGKRLITVCPGWSYEQIAQDLAGNWYNWVKIKDSNGNSVYSGDAKKPYTKVITAGDILDIIGLFSRMSSNYSKDFLDKLAYYESREDTVNNGYGLGPGHPGYNGYLGRYQLGEYALEDAGFYVNDGNPLVQDWIGTWTAKAKEYGVTSAATFTNNVAAQEYAVRQYHKRLWEYIKPYHKYIGQTMRSIKVTASGLLAAAHLVGNGSMTQYFDESQSCPVDGNNTPATLYMSEMGGYDLTELLGCNPDGNLSSESGSGSQDIDKFLLVAKGELGYKETPINKTKYGDWYDMDGQSWCIMFISWCADQVGILNTVIHKQAHAYYMKKDYNNKGKYKTRESEYTPCAGDIVIFSRPTLKDPVTGNLVIDPISGELKEYYHGAIVEAYDPNTLIIYTIEGNSDNSVMRRTHGRNETIIDGYGINGGTTYGQVPIGSVGGTNGSTL